jgi:hypothetical protein
MNRSTSTPIIFGTVAIVTLVVLCISWVGGSEFSNLELRQAGGDLRMKDLFPADQKLALSLPGYFARAFCTYGWLLPVATLLAGGQLLRAPQRSGSTIAWYCCGTLVILALWLALTVIGIHATFIYPHHLS